MRHLIKKTFFAVCIANIIINISQAQTHTSMPVGKSYKCLNISKDTIEKKIGSIMKFHLVDNGKWSYPIFQKINLVDSFTFDPSLKKIFNLNQEKEYAYFSLSPANERYVPDDYYFKVLPTCKFDPMKVHCLFERDNFYDENPDASENIKKFIFGVHLFELLIDIQEPGQECPKSKFKMNYDYKFSIQDDEYEDLIQEYPLLKSQISTSKDKTLRSSELDRFISNFFDAYFINWVSDDWENKSL